MTKIINFEERFVERQADQYLEIYRINGTSDADEWARTCVPPKFHKRLKEEISRKLRNNNG